MKKLIIFALTLLLICCMAVPAYAATPSLDVPDIPDFSNIEFDIKLELPDNFWSNWFDKNPINWKLPIPSTKTEITIVFSDALKNLLG